MVIIESVFTLRESTLYECAERGPYVINYSRNLVSLLTQPLAQWTRSILGELSRIGGYQAKSTLPLTDAVVLNFRQQYVSWITLGFVKFMMDT